MIRKPLYLFELLQWADHAHKDAARLVRLLRDGTATIWTQADMTPDPHRLDLVGWRKSVATKYRNMRDLGGRASVVPAVATALAGAADSGPRIFAAIDAALGAHREQDGTLRAEPLTAAERTQLADAIDAELEQ